MVKLLKEAAEKGKEATTPGEVAGAGSSSASATTPGKVAGDEGAGSGSAAATTPSKVPGDEVAGSGSTAATPGQVAGDKGTGSGSAAGSGPGTTTPSKVASDEGPSSGSADPTPGNVAGDAGAGADGDEDGDETPPATQPRNAAFWYGRIPKRRRLEDAGNPIELDCTVTTVQETQTACDADLSKAMSEWQDGQGGWCSESGKGVGDADGKGVEAASDASLGLAVDALPRTMVCLRGLRDKRGGR